MELVCQNRFPDLFHLFCFFRTCKNLQQFRIHKELFTSAVGALIPSHGSISSSVILEVKLSFPHRKPFISGHSPVKLFKIFSRKFLAYLRNTLDSLLHPLGCLQHISCRAAAAVAISVADKDIIVYLLVLISVPSAHDRIRVEHTVVCGKEVVLALTHTQSRDQMCQDLTSVDSAPHHSVIRNLIDLIPCQFCSHKILDSTALHDLRKCP